MLVANIPPPPALPERRSDEGADLAAALGARPSDPPLPSTDEAIAAAQDRARAVEHLHVLRALSRPAFVDGLLRGLMWGVGAFAVWAVFRPGADRAPRR